MKQKSVKVAIAQILEALPVILEAAEEGEQERKRVAEVRKTMNKKLFGKGTVYGKMNWNGEELEETPPFDSAREMCDAPAVTKPDPSMFTTYDNTAEGNK